MKTKERDYYFDNLKGFLILCVIIGNSLESFYTPNIDTHYFILLLYLFHMPAMAFISGYFCNKSKRSTQSKVIDTLKIYLFVQLFYYLFNRFYMKSELKFQFFNPNWTLWYLLALSIWYVISDYIVNYKKSIIIAILLSLLIGFDTSIGSYASISRVFFFLPFFTAGMAFNKDKFIDKHKKYSIFLSILVLIILLVAYKYSSIIEVDYLFEYTNYQTFSDNVKIPFITRIFHYISASIIISFLLIIFTSKKSFLSWIGKNSLIFYICHSGVIRILMKSELNILRYNTLPELIISECIIIIVLILITYSYKELKSLYKNKVKHKN